MQLSLYVVFYAAFLAIGLQKLHDASARNTEPKTWPVKVFAILDICKENYSETEWFKRLDKLLIYKFMFKMDEKLIPTLTETAKTCKITHQPTNTRLQ